MYCSTASTQFVRPARIALCNSSIVASSTRKGLPSVPTESVMQMLPSIRTANMSAPRGPQARGPDQLSTTVGLAGQAAFRRRPCRKRRAASFGLLRKVAVPNNECQSVRHKQRQGHMVEQFAADASQQGLTELRVMIGAGDDQIGVEVGGARQQHFGDRQ